MAPSILSHLQNLWPFSLRYSLLKIDDLKLSNRLVRRLSIPQQTKQFVFAARDPDSNAVVYILAAQNLSEQSASDAEQLIKEVQPKAVVAQVARSALAEIRAEDKSLGDDQANNIPTSYVGVLKRCLFDKINKEQYDHFAGCQVLQEIFGIGFYGHLLAARRAADEVDSQFLLLESPYENNCSWQPPGRDITEDQGSGLNLHSSCLLPGKVTPAIYSGSKRLCLSDALQFQMVKSIIPSLEFLFDKAGSSGSASEANPGESRPFDDYQAPPFAQSVYPLLADLYNIFNDLPAIGKALVSAQKVLANVNEGEPVDTQHVSEVHSFRIAIEGLRVALNNAGRCPIDKVENNKSTGLQFSELPSEEKCHVLFALALRYQARKFGTVVAVVDAGSLAGLRRHWTTSVPSEVADMATQCVTQYVDDGDLDYDEEIVMEHAERKRLLADKPVVAIGAGATAVLGATSLSKAVPASTIIKLATYKVPVALKIGLAHLQRAVYIGLGKFLGPMKLLPGFSNFGASTSSALKLTTSAEKIRAVTHGMIASAERTSLLAIRTSFYEIMRMRNVGTLKIAPWATFGCSLAAGSGLLLYGDGIECAAESIPSFPMIASLGRGLQSLQQASQEVRQRSGTKVQDALQSLIENAKKN